MLRALVVLLATLWAPLALAADPTLAVLYFDNQGNEQLEPLKVGLAQMLITDLQPTEGVTVVERARLQAILDELELGHSGMVDPDRAAKIGKLLGAEWILLGGYFELAGTLRIDARLVRVETGQILHATGASGTTPGFLELQDTLAAELRTHLARRVEGRATPANAPHPPASLDRGASTPRGGAVKTDSASGDGLARPDADTVTAAVAYSEGLMFMDHKDTARARASFEKAVAADPALDDARTALASLDL